MKRLATLLVALLSMLALSAIPAEAAALGVSARAAVHTAGVPHVDFTARTSRIARVKVTVYSGTRVVRSFYTRRVGLRYAAAWNLKDSGGRAVKPGVYSYRVVAAASRAVGSARGKVRVPPAPAPVPAPAPAPVPGDPTATGRWFGFYTPGAPASMTPLTTLEAQLGGVHAAVVNFYISDSESFPASRVAAVAAHGSVPMITLEFMSLRSGGVAAINNGSKDAYLGNFADAAAASGSEIWIRPFHEMNGDWYPWAGTVNGNTPAQVVAAWRHVKDVFTAHGATNVKFVWAVNNESVPNTTANAIASYWPGDAYVDYLAIDGYNFGTSKSWSTWRSFSSVIGDSYTKVTALSAKPLFLAEVGSVEQGGDKAAWITDMFRAIPASYPRITGVCWFNLNDGVGNTDWRVDSSSASLAAFQAATAAGY